MSSWWGKDDTRDPREGRERRAKTIMKIKANVTKMKTNSNIK